MINIRKTQALTIFYFLIGVLSLSAQYAWTPLNIRQKDWKIIRTEHYDVIFPAEMEKEGRYVADSLEYLFPLWQKTLKPVRNHRFPVILYPDYMGTNGFVSIAPRRSVYYATPSGTMNGDWMSALAVHEGRHMIQVDAADRNTMHALYCIFGERILLPVIPMWCFEGDAVMTETLFTQMGRGRDPGFTMDFKALMLDDKNYGYNKMMMGSYKDPIPDWYTFGYLMYAWIRSEYDPDAPETIFHAGSQVPLPAIGSTIGVKRATGKYPRQVYREMAAAYRDFWKKQISSMSLTDRSVIYRESDKHYSFQSHLAFLSDGTAIVSSYDRDKSYRIISLKNGDRKEHVLTRAKPLNSLTAGGSLVVWDELVSDVKFDKAMTRIVILDTETGRKRVIKGGGRYLYPSLTPDGKILAVTEWLENYNSRLVLLDSQNGEKRGEIPIPENEFWCDLSWSENGRKIIFVSNGAKGKSLKRMDPETGIIEILLSPTGENFRQPFEKNGEVFYVSAFSGIESIWCLTARGERLQITARPLGSWNPVIQPGTGNLWFIDYDNSLGTVIASQEINRSNWIPLNKVKVSQEDFFAPLLASETGTASYSRGQVPQGSEPVEDYSFALSGQRLDSWGISSLGSDPLNSPEVDLYVNIDSIAGTSSQQVIVGYQFNERNLGIGYNLRLRRFGPDLVLTTGSVMRNLGDEPFNESSAKVGLEWPMGESVTEGLSWSITPGTTITGAVRTDLDGEVMEKVLPLTHSLSADISWSRWSAALSGSFAWHPFVDSPRNHTAITGGIRIPGPFARDSFSINGAWEKQNSGDISLVSFPRGWDSISSEHLLKAGADYRFPLLYPDLPIGAVAYFTQITGDLFYDRLQDLETEETYSSAGAEILFYFYPLQLPVELNFGFRFSWQFETGLPIFELTLTGIPIGLN